MNLRRFWRAVLPGLCGIFLGANAYAADRPGERVERATLTNGLRVVVVYNPLAPVAATVLNYKVGSDETPAGFPGTAHALEHMMFRGSPGLSAAQLADVSTALGGDNNADTQQAVTQYFFTVPAQDLDLALRIEAIRMRGLAEDPDLWNKERGAIEQEVAQDLSNPEYVFYTKLLEAMFKGSPYEHDALGTRPSFDKTTPEMLRQFHQNWYVPNNAILVIVGDVDPKKAITSATEFFGAIPSRPLPSRPNYSFQPVQAQTVRLQTDLPAGMAVLSFRFPGSDNPDYAAATVLGDVLSSQRGNLYGLVPQGKALAASFSYDSMPHSGLGYAIAEYPAGGNGDNLISELRAILTGEITNGLPADLVEAAKRREIASAELQRNSIAGLAMVWSEALAVEGRNSPDEDVDAIKRVTVDDVRRVAKKYLDFSAALTAVLTPQPSGQPISSKSFGGKESFTPKEAKNVNLPSWAQESVARLEIPASTLHPFVTNLANGLRLIVQPESISDTVSVYGRVKSNPAIQEPPGKEGANMLLEELFSYGTKTLDRLAFQKALDEIGAMESAGTNFSLQVLSDQFDRGVQLLADNVLNPALPEEAFKIMQPQMAEAVAGEMESPSYLVTRSLRTRLLPKSDPSLRQTTPKTIQGLGLKDVEDFYHHAFRPDMTTMVVIGKVTPEQALQTISKYFGNWKTAGPQPNTIVPAVPPNTTGVALVPDASRVQDKVILAEVLGVTRTNSDFYPLELGNHVLGGAFYATRLYRDLRENAGLVYFVSSDFGVGLTRGTYAVEYACDPPNVSKARAIVVSNLKAMQQHDVTERELRQAKVLLLREIPLSEASIESIAGGWLGRTLLNLPLDEPLRAAHKYVQLNASDVRAAFSKWIRPDDLVQVTQGPTPH